MWRDVSKRTPAYLESAVYVDTCVVSGLAKGDLPSKEHRALNLLRDHRLGHLQLATSPFTEHELDAIPERYRFAHTAICNLLGEIPITYVSNDEKRAVSDPNFWLYERLYWLLPDELDAAHVYCAVTAGTEYFLTVDAKTILKYRRELLSQFGIRVMRPSAFLSSWRRRVFKRRW